MRWNTKITDLLNCRYPILQGAMDKIGTWQFAADVAETGAHGTITASVSGTPESLRADIRRCRQATGGSFGVNLSIGICPRIDEMLEVCIEEKVPVETSVYKPDALARRIGESGLTWLHKAARIKDALHAQELGVNAIILVGAEGAGIKNPEQLPTLTTLIWGLKKLSCPVVAAGGIGDARGLLAALAAGAEGVMMGSALMTARECPIGIESKEKIIKLSLDDSEFRQRVLSSGQPHRRASDTDVDLKEIDWSKAASFAVAGIDRVYSVGELISNIISAAEGMEQKKC